MNQTKAKMLALSLEMTRRCNLNCIWCCKGQSQNMDISKEVIDKSLDELQGIALRSLQFFGGEPFLVPELLEYVVDGVIERHLIIGTARAFTNGTIKDERIINALNRLAGYLKSIEPEINSMDLQDIGGNFFVSGEDKGFEPNCKVFVTISESYHENANVAKSTFEYYIARKDRLVTFRLERHIGEKEFRTCIVGNAEKNFHKLVKSKTKYYAGKKCALQLGAFRIPQHKRIISTDDSLIGKTITISANGNVFVGSNESYEDVDSNPMFNILVCNGDLVARLLDFSWKYPVYPNANNFREMYLTVKYIREHGKQ